VELYAKRRSLPETLLATRAALQQWSAEQASLRGAVQAAPWYGLRVGDKEHFDPSRAFPAGQGSEPPPVGPASRWLKCPVDGTGNPSLAGQPIDYLFTTITARHAGTLSIELSRHEGYGGFAYRPPASGAGLEPSAALLWVEGRPVTLRDRLEGYARVPVAKRRGWHDAILVDLPLQPGANHVVIALGKGARRSWFTSVKLNSNPVAALWPMIEHDFPRSRSRLLEAANHPWYEPVNGWFWERGAARFEEELLTNLLARLGPRGAAIEQHCQELRRDHAQTSDPRWLTLCVTAAELCAGLRDLDNTGAAIREIAAGWPERYRGERLLARATELEQRWLEQSAQVLDPSDASTARLLRDLEDFRREALVAENPLLAGKQLLFVKRFTYDSDHYYDEFNAGIRRFGGGLYVLSLRDGSVKPVAPELGQGLTDRYDLSFDARRVVFDYKRPKPEGFRLFEVGVDGTGLRQLTFPPADEPERMAAYATCSREELERNPGRYGHWTDDMHPCYLPDGGVVFTSTRSERSVLCGGHSLTVANLHRIDADGGGLRRLSEGALSEFCPSVLVDGRIIYNRWEYVDKGAGAVQSLWAMYPDGSRSEEVYGDNITTPAVLTQPRAVPGAAHQVVCLGAGHCPGNMGAIVLVDFYKDKRTSDAMNVLTPGCLPKGNWGLRQFRNGQWQADIYGPWYADPYPLDDASHSPLAGKFFLVSCNAEGMWNDPAGYGLYLLDVFGNRVPIYQDPEISCWQARPLEPRAKPPVSVGSVALAQPTAEQEATVVLSDVYQGLDGVPRGTVKYLRVMEQVPRPWSVYKGYQPDDSSPGQMVAVSLYAHLSVKVLHGIVPVRSDGSACFTVPAKRDLFFQALDENFMEVQRMRTFVNLQPAERRSCIGCHEARTHAPISHRLLALNGPPDRPVAQPGEIAPRPIHYPTDVQPIFDRHCVSCHNPKRTDGGLDLSGDLTELFCRSYEALINKDLVGYIQEFVGPKPEGADAMGYAPAVPPYTYGSHKSKLIAALRAGHYEVKLPREDFIKLATWVDANAPYYGSYFGHRNLSHRNKPDFRPTPTLESALGLSQAGPGAVR
jgi:hypothetical protein